MGTTDKLTSQVSFMRLNPLVSYKVNESVTLGSIRLLGMCLNTLQISADGRIATLELRRKFVEDAGTGGLEDGNLRVSPRLDIR